MALAYLALGSNLGDRGAILDQAIRRLRAQPHVRLVERSSFYETEPVGGPPGQPNYLNAVVSVQTDLTPERLLAVLLAIESLFGRTRGVPNAPRTLDLDLLLYDDLVRESPDPIVPHPRMHDRRFVLAPLAEIAPDVRHPVFHTTIRELLARLPEGEKIERLPPFWATVARDLVGLRAVVTGSTSGIGQAIATEFAEAGASVIVHGYRSLNALEHVAEHLRSFGGKAEPIQADLRDPAACDRLVEAAWQLFGGIDIWVNNAGADTLTGDAGKWPFDRKLEDLFAVDVMATVRLSRAIGARMRAASGGVILTTGWDQAETGMEGDSGQLFATIKGAVTAFTRSLAVELAPKVRVNCLAPGWIRTAWGETASAAWQDRVERETPLRCWGLPEDVAHAAHWLASPAAQFMTGQVVRVNGGAIR